MTGCLDCHKLMAVDRSSRKSLHSIELSMTIPSKPHKFVDGIFFSFVIFGFFLSGFVCLFVGLFLLFVRHSFFVYLILLRDGFYFPLNTQHILIYYHSLLGQILLSIRNIFYIFLIFYLFYFALCGFCFLFVLFCVFCWGFFCLCICILLCIAFFCLFLFCFCFCLLFIYCIVHSNLYRTLIVFNITLAWRTNILKVTKHSQHYISITWQTFWKGRSIHNITLTLRRRILKGT
jgi:hypothetical protein